MWLGRARSTAIRHKKHAGSTGQAERFKAHTPAGKRQASTLRRIPDLTPYLLLDEQGADGTGVVGLHSQDLGGGGQVGGVAQEGGGALWVNPEVGGTGWGHT